MTDDELLPLPKPTMYFGHSTTFPMYGAEEMRDYARAAIAAEREACAELCEAHAGMRSTGAWNVLMAAADRIRERAAPT